MPTETVERLIRVDEVMNRTGLTRSLMYQLMKTGDFPKSVTIAGRAVAWQESAVSRWIQGRIEAAKG